MTGHVSSRLVLAARGLHAFHGRIEVVFGVDFALASGEILVVLGANGAGKSSLLTAIAGGIRSDGALELAGNSIAGLSTQQRAEKGLAFVPERRGNVFAPMSVAENLEIGLRLSPRDRRPHIRKGLFDLFPILREREDAQAGALSGGEQQMLAIAMALGREPSVLILYEPSHGLAPMIFDLGSVQGIALLVAEQNLPFAGQIADRYFVLSHGVVAAEGGKGDLSDHADMLDAYISE
ncbi:MAG: ATP-binding cassette domain-containing protein [Afipia sp.]|nr:ATP-binding cassette domain-containing protein [Afipia sp.]